MKLESYENPKDKRPKLCVSVTLYQRTKTGFKYNGSVSTSWREGESLAMDVYKQLAFSLTTNNLVVIPNFPGWIDVRDVTPNEKGLYLVASFIKNKWTIREARWDGKYFVGTNELKEILIVHNWQHMPPAPWKSQTPTHSWHPTKETRRQTNYQIEE